MATAATAAALAASLLLSASRVRRQRAGAPPSLLAARRLTATFRRSQATGVLFSTGYNRSVFHCLSLSFHRLSTALLAPDTAFALRAGGAWHRWLRSSCTGHPARPGAPDKTRHTLTLYSTACGSESGGWEPGWALMTDLSRRNVAAAAAAAAAAAPGTLPHNPDGALLMFLSARALAAQARAAADIGVEPYFNRRRLCCQAPRSAPSGRKGAILDPESLSSRSLTSVPVHRWSG